MARVNPAENLRRIEAQGLAAQVFPLKAEAHTLPFASGYFDMIVSLDAYHYFGTDDLYLGYILKFLKPGGCIGIAAPGLAEELPGGPPEELRPHWNWEFCSFHSPGWWRRHWSKTGLVEIKHADSLANGWESWAEWDECCVEAGAGLAQSSGEWPKMLRLDKGRTLVLTRIIARRPAENTGQTP